METPVNTKIDIDIQINNRKRQNNNSNQRAQTAGVPFGNDKLKSIFQENGTGMNLFELEDFSMA